MGESSPVKTSCSLMNSTRTPRRVRPWTRANNRVAVADEPEQFGQLRPCGVPAGGLVREDPVQDLALELAQLILIKGADPHVANALTVHGGLQSSVCENECRLTQWTGQVLLGCGRIALTRRAATVSLGGNNLTVV
ncbi:hypothetical protein GCM10011577_38780 [Pseudarthrobacter polychromogenes]|uniref:Uncharacterized protein n=1 Tax=Pseudarthrobacter polychromogenes TaxID=1676 RepID=A0ABQ1Y2I7_9MICC|nr:hypothetical protein GCM10011577_38780 [Pseudarthrobacter polychromogenes]